MVKPSKKPATTWLDHRSQSRAKYLRQERWVAIRIVVEEIKTTDEPAQIEGWDPIPDCLK